MNEEIYSELASISRAISNLELRIEKLEQQFAAMRAELREHSASLVQLRKEAILMGVNAAREVIRLERAQKAAALEQVPA